MKRLLLSITLLSFFITYGSAQTIQVLTKSYYTDRVKGDVWAMTGTDSLHLHVRNNVPITSRILFNPNSSVRFRDEVNKNYKEWSNNTIYPQAIIVMDLNHVQSINDIKGYEEGDKQIKAAANVLIKTQLDNSDIIRTDGNEFVVYLVGYSQKQLTNYIHKLNKELKKLPYNYGAEFGYSMIIDDIKTIEDALNEATKALKKQKELNENKD